MALGYGFQRFSAPRWGGERGRVLAIDRVIVARSIDRASRGGCGCVGTVSNKSGHVHGHWHWSESGLVGCVFGLISWDTQCSVPQPISWPHHHGCTVWWKSLSCSITLLLHRITFSLVCTRLGARIVSGEDWMKCLRSRCEAALSLSLSGMGLAGAVSWASAWLWTLVHPSRHQRRETRDETSLRNNTAAYLAERIIIWFDLLNYRRRVISARCLIFEGSTDNSKVFSGKCQPSEACASQTLMCLNSHTTVSDPAAHTARARALHTESCPCSTPICIEPMPQPPSKSFMAQPRATCDEHVKVGHILNPIIYWSILSHSAPNCSAWHKNHAWSTILIQPSIIRLWFHFASRRELQDLPFSSPPLIGSKFLHLCVVLKSAIGPGLPFTQA